MPKISKRGNEMPSSPIRKLVPFAEEAKKRGVKVYHLNIGQPDIPTPENAIEAVRNVKDKVIEYSHSAGNESYRRKLAANYYQKAGIDVDFTNIFITTGGSEAISFAFFAALNPGDEVIIPEPYYTNYSAFAQTADVILKPVTSYIETGFALPPISEFEKIITPKTKGIAICNPNNPTGYLYSREEIEALAKIVKKHDLYLFSDEVYREFSYDGAEHFSVMNIKEIENNVVMFDSVSKRYSACGVRVGHLVSKNKEFMAAVLKYAQARLSPPSLGQILGEAAIDVPDTYFKQVYEEYINRRNYMIAELNKMEGVKAPMPKGAFYSIVELPIDDSDKFCEWILSDFSYKNQTVMMAPATGFYATPGLGKNQVRMAYVLKIDDLKNAMEVLKEALKVYPGRVK